MADIPDFLETRPRVRRQLAGTPENPDGHIVVVEQDITVYSLWCPNDVFDDQVRKLVLPEADPASIESGSSYYRCTCGAVFGPGEHARKAAREHLIENQP